MGSIFKFKQFKIDQSGCAMKINTDGVLLGAIAGFSVEINFEAADKRILDIGTGTGVIALMLAQRFPKSIIDAVEIDSTAAQAAAINFKQSPFSDRLKAFLTDIITFEPENRYDLVVSNPPYFVNDQKSAEQRKMVARHTDERFFESLVIKVKELLNENGQFWLILPVKQADLVIEKAMVNEMHLKKEISIHSDETKPVIRKIICLGKTASTPEKSNFFIYKERDEYTDAYKILLNGFFLAL